MMTVSASLLHCHTLLLLCLLWSEYLNVAHARIIYVDAASVNPVDTCTGLSEAAACPTIQSGLLLAGNNDTVLMQPGIYSGQGNEGIVFGNSSETVVGVKLSGNLNNAPNTDVLIRCTRENRFLTSFNNYFAHISDFSVDSCHSSTATGASIINVGGGGIEVVHSSGISISNILFTNNTARYGGAVLIQDSSSVVIRACSFENNVAVYWGGAIKVFESGLTIESSHFMGNECDGSLVDEPYFNVNTENIGGGGAVHANQGSYITILYSQFYGNSARVMAGALCVSTMGSATLIENTFTENRVHGGETCFNDANCKIRAGAIAVSNTVTDILDSNFTNNYAVTSDISKFAEGGALYIRRDASVTKNTDLTITGAYFFNNSAYGTGDNNSGGQGGAILVNGINVILSLCRFEKNFARSDGMFTEFPSAGGALYVTEIATTSINDCFFLSNYVDGGRAGAIFATDSNILLIFNSTLRNNFVTSSYNFKSSGGAISIAQRATTKILNCTFRRNFANPRLLLSPRTYSGVGGAVFIESATAVVEDCFFFDNFATSGQFDSGGSGGAIGIENCYDVRVARTMFVLNSARGFDDTNTYSNSGSGGAISLMFSSAYIDSCLFSRNLVSAGGAEFSVGGAVAVFYNFLETSNTPAPPPLQFYNCEFTNNGANGEVCSSSQIVRAGQGGAVAIIGVALGGVIFNQSTFTRNIANTESEGIVSSFGGAVFYALGSKVSFHDCSLLKNVAFNGLGDDVCSGFAGDYNNDLQFYEPILDSVTPLEARLIHASLLNLIEVVCDNFDLQRNKDGNLVYPESVKDWSSRWDQIFNQFPDPWNGVAFTADPVSFEHEEALLFDNSPRKWEMYDRITNHRSSSPSLFFGFVDLRHFPSVLVSSGIASFYYPSFVNQSYQICAGDMLGLLADQGQGQSSGDTSSLLRPSLVIVGDVRTSALEIVGISANVTIVDQSSRAAVMMRSILIVNSTLYHSNNINVSASSAIIGSTISSFIPPSVSNITVGSNYMPVITFQGEIVTGFPSTEGTDIAIIKLIQDRIFSADINLLRSSIRIMGRITFSSLSNQNDPLFNHTVLFVSLYNRSTIFVETSGEMVIDAVTNILAENISQAAIVNAGLINVGDKDSSHTKGLRVYGNIIQTINATTKIRISNENYITPALVLASNFSFLGNLNVTTVSGTTFIPSSDSSNPSSWRIIEYFDSVESASFSELGLRSYYPDGLYFDDTMTYYEDLDLNVEVPTLDTADLKTDVATGLIMNLRRLDDRAEDWTSFPNSMSTLETDIKMERNLGINDFDNDTETWVHTITSSAMSCSARNDYYDFEGNGDSSDYRCHVCLHNASCGYCSGTMDGCQSTSSSSCDNGIYFHKANCCPDGCNNRGTCDANSDYTSFTCDCNIFWDGSSCDDLSIFTYLLTSVGIFSIVIALITVRYYFKYRHQKKKVLDDLRENLLGGGQNYGSMTQQSYLQGIQQDLILRDVFVPYEEIKLEKKIGEGSFGEVYLATFRGAQVAVKQMRAPVFLQFTDNDIEEFRKEAYMMSRLRHPNIVLVMGVSILEQEAPLPPPGYDDDEDISPRGRIASVDSMSDKKRTTSTDFRGGKKAEAERKIRSVCIITEYLEQGSLADILYGHNKVADDVWTYELVLTCALQAARGMLYLHSYQPPICHRDLKSSNLVVDDHWVVKVTDFGMSRIVPTKIQNIETGIDKDPNETMTSDYDTKIINEDTGSIASTRKVGFDESANETWERESFIDVDNMIERNSNTEMTSNLGTTAWCAPELLAQSNKTKYSVKVDVYSFGMVLWELWERKKPYEEMTSRFDIIDAVRAGRRPTISTNCPPTFRSLIQRCWHELPARRPTFAYIVRYIKDELAHIKRQRTMSTSFSPYSVSHLLNTQSTSGVDPSAAARAVQRAYNNSISSPQPSSEYPQPSTDYTSMRDTYEPPPITQIVEGDERDSVRKSSSLLSFMFKQNSTVSTSKSSVSDNQSISSVKSAPNRAWATPSHMQSPSDRNTISGADGLNRGPSADDLTYLAQTPVASSNLENIATSRDYQNGAASGGGLRHDQSTVRSHGQWRDKYVLKFNGWNSTKPDSNLPPSAARSTQSPLHADTHQRVRPPVSDDKSSEGSGGGHPSFEDSKEVYAHGKLLHPRSTYEMDLMSSSRSEGPRHGYDSKEEADRLQRKRTNSL